jgi:hypothetical protein
MEYFREILEAEFPSRHFWKIDLSLLDLEKCGIVGMNKMSTQGLFLFLYVLYLTLRKESSNEEANE